MGRSDLESPRVCLCVLHGVPLVVRRGHLSAWMYLGGFMGVSVVAAGAFIPGRIPFSTYFICLVAGQLGCSFLYDRCGCCAQITRIQT